METLNATVKRSSLIQVNSYDTYLSTIQWLSELEFCKTELSLLSKFLDKAFMRSHKQKEYSELLRLDKRVKVFLNYTLKSMQNKIAEHEKHFILLDENIFTQDEQLIYDEHYENEQCFLEFKNELTRLKNELLQHVAVEWKAASFRNYAL